jgi:hypothetical protein
MILLQYIFWIFLLLSMGMILFFVVEELAFRREQQRRDRLQALYQTIWTGYEEDRIDAWDRVIGYLENYSSSRELLSEARERKKRLRLRLQRGLWVDGKGNLLDESA